MILSIHKRRAGWVNVTLFLLIGLTLAGCAPLPGLVRDGQILIERESSYPGGARIGQSLEATWDGLQGVQVYVAAAPQDSQLTLNLYTAPDRLELLRSASAGFSRPGWIQFDFAPLTSDGRDFYFELVPDPPTQIRLGTTAGASYLPGAGYRDGAAIDSQLAFQLVYHRAWAAAYLLRLAFQWILVVAGVLLLFTVPGWLLGHLALPDWKDLSLLEKAALSSGIGLALYPLLFLLARQVGFAPGPASAWIPGLLSLAALGILRWRRGRPSAPPSAARPDGPPIRRVPAGKTPTRPIPARKETTSRWPAILLALMLALLVISRLWAIRTIDVPLFGDSLSHTLTTRLFLDQGALPGNWLPYEPYETFTVQWGFSLIAALLGWLLRLSDLQAVLVAGQVANVLAVVGLAPLAMRLAPDGPRRLWAAAGAILAAGFLINFPAAYTNWGRYAQLSGQAILPAATWLAWNLIGRGDQRPAWGQAALLGAVTAGMILHYYRMAFFLTSFVLALGLLTWLPRYGRSWAAWKNLAAVSLVATIVTVLLFSPWLGQMQGAALAETAVSGPVTGDRAANVWSDYRDWTGLLVYYPVWQVVAGLLSLAYALLRRRWAAVAFVLGMGFLASVPAAALLGLPAANFMSAFSGLIFMYAPIALLFAGVFADGLAWASRSRLASVLAGALIVAGLLWGTREVTRAVRPAEYAIAARSDVIAADWITRSLPADGRRFLVAAYWYPLYNSVVGADGGWWLSILAGRQTTVPVQYPLLNERPVEPDYNERIYALTQALLAAPPGDETVRTAMCALNVGYAYIGQHKAPGPGEEFSPMLFTALGLEQSGWFDRVYQHDYAQVFVLRDGICP